MGCMHSKVPSDEMSATDNPLTGQTTMKAVVVHKVGDPEDEAVLSVIDDAPIGEPARGEILVRVHAAAVNPIDYKLTQGDVPGVKQNRFGHDVAGVVEKVGADCTMFKVGDEVYGMLKVGDTAKNQGSFAEFLSVKECSLAPKPAGSSAREAAALPLAGLTAYQGLTGSGIAVEGARIGILGGSGGVGSLAIQIAKALGASHIVTTSSNADFVRALGADEVINYREANVAEALKGSELDLVFDCVGGVESWAAARAGLKKTNGKFCTIVGDSDKPSIGMVPGIVNRKFWSNFGFPTYRWLLVDGTKQADLVAITGLVEEGKVKPILDERHFTLDTKSVHQMIAAIKTHRTKGKLVMDVAAGGETSATAEAAVAEETREEAVM
jgi:NADPH:quinone reductase-like Zn-dependent oxidoreductase